MLDNIEYHELESGHGFCAKSNGQQIGEIDIVIVGANRLIIESMRIDKEFDSIEICRNLVKCVADMARRTGRKILCLCPRAQSIFNRYPEFDDVRMIKIAA